jgi:hypothetical protein
VKLVLLQSVIDQTDPCFSVGSKICEKKRKANLAGLSFFDRRLLLSIFTLLILFFALAMESNQSNQDQEKLDVDSKSVKELKDILRERNVDFSDCLEKSDLVVALRFVKLIV